MNALALLLAAVSPIYQLHFIPNDPYYAEQWAPPLMQMEEAWDSPSEAPLVAVIDSGLWWPHPDRPDYWENPGEAGEKRANGVDDDGNGYIDDWRGWDFVNDDNDPFDDNSHGTYVSGIISAKRNNGIGVSGLSDAKIMVLKAFDLWGWGTAEDVAEAMNYALDKGAKIINMSFGGPDYLPVAMAVERARREGVMLVASMGNNGLPMRIYPAAYPWVIAVGATDRDDRRAAFSTWGCWMDVSAPGKDIFGLWPAFSSGYANMSGTSASAPQVSGLLAWVWSRHPEWRAENWQDWLGQAAKDLGERGYDPRFGKGRVQYDWVSGKLERGECGTQIEL